jgi:hypothetical protein
MGRSATGVAHYPRLRARPVDKRTSAVLPFPQLPAPPGLPEPSNDRGTSLRAIHIDPTFDVRSTG